MIDKMVTSLESDPFIDQSGSQAISSLVNSRYYTKKNVLEHKENGIERKFWLCYREVSTESTVENKMADATSLCVIFSLFLDLA